MLRMPTCPVAKVSCGNFVSNRPTSFILGCRQENSKPTLEKIQTKQYRRQSGKEQGDRFSTITEVKEDSVVGCGEGGCEAVSLGRHPCQLLTSLSHKTL